MEQSALDAVVPCGYLIKQSKHLQIPRTRWCEIKDHCLYSYKNKQHNNNPTEIIDLSLYHRCKLVEEKKKNKNKRNYTFKLCNANETNNRFFQTETHAAVNKWLHDLTDAFKQIYRVPISIQLSGANGQTLYFDKAFSSIIKRVDDISYKIMKIESAHDKILQNINITNLEQAILAAFTRHGVNYKEQYSLQFKMKIGYLEYGGVSNFGVHNKGLQILINQEEIILGDDEKHIIGGKSLIVDWGEGFSVSVLNNHHKLDLNKFDRYGYSKAFDLSENKTVHVLVINTEFTTDICIDTTKITSRQIVSKMNQIYHPSRFIWEKWITMYETAALVVENYEHYVSSANITCPHMLDHDRQNDDEKQQHLEYQLMCPIYAAMKSKYNFNEENLSHLNEYTHFTDEFEEKPACKYQQQCFAFVRLEEGGNRLDDRCHMKMYRHPPRSRQIKLSENINAFVMNKNNEENHLLHQPVTSDKTSLYEKDGYLIQLIHEIIQNGYESDLCITNDDLENKYYSLMNAVDNKIYLQRHILMGCPLNFFFLRDAA